MSIEARRALGVAVMAVAVGLVGLLLQPVAGLFPDPIDGMVAIVGGWAVVAAVVVLGYALFKLGRALTRED